MEGRTRELGPKQVERPARRTEPETCKVPDAERLAVERERRRDQDSSERDRIVERAVARPSGLGNASVREHEAHEERLTEVAWFLVTIVAVTVT